MKKNLLVLLLTALSLFGQSEWIEQGNQAMSNGGYESAITYYTRAIKEGMDNTQNRYLLGTAYYKAAISYLEQDNYRRAIEYFEQSAAEGYQEKELPKNLVTAYLKLASLFEPGPRKENCDKAIEFCQKALSIDESNAEAYRIMAGANVAKEELEEAVACYKKSLALEPENSETLKKFGLFFIALEMYDHALPIFQKYAEINPNSAYSYNSIGYIQIKKALDIQDKNPDDRNSIESLFAEALQNIQKAIKLDPKHISAITNLGLVYHYQGDNDKAVKNFQKAIALDAKYATAYNGLGLVYCSLGLQNNVDDAFGDKNGFSKAIKNYQKAIELNKMYAEAYRNLGYVFAQRNKKGDNDLAYQNYQKAIGFKADDANTYFNLSELYSNLGKIPASKECLIKAAKLGLNKAIKLCQQSRISW